jgi:peptidyl-prolyl cis-trans isomerase C
MSKLFPLRASVLGLAFLFAAGVPLASSALAASSTVLAKVNGKEITEDDLKVVAEDLGSNLPPQLQGKARDAYLLDYLIDGELIAQKAIADKLDQDPEFPKRLAYIREKLLMESVLRKLSKEVATDDAMKKTYEEVAKAQKPETEIHARHILVPTEDDAQAALKRVKAGEDFAKVAKELSKDPGSEGGDLGWFTKDRMVPEFAEAAFKLEPGQVSEPVKSQFGWHIIKVEGKREKAFPAFDEVKDQVARYVVQKAEEEMITKLRKDAKIERMVPAENSTPATPPADNK